MPSGTGHQTSLLQDVLSDVPQRNDARRPGIRDPKAVARRKAYFLDNPQDFASQISRMVKKVHDLIPEPRDHLTCWLHPNPPTVRGRPAGTISKGLTIFTPGHDREKLSINIGVLILLQLGPLSAEHRHGFVHSSWHLSHRCGNWTCLNPQHLTIEEPSINLERNSCMRLGTAVCAGEGTTVCRHNPTCLAYLKLRQDQLIDNEPWQHIIRIDYRLKVPVIVKPLAQRRVRRRFRKAFMDKSFEQTLAVIQLVRKRRWKLILGIRQAGSNVDCASDIPVWKSRKINKAIRWLEEYHAEFTRRARLKCHYFGAQGTNLRKHTPYYQSLVNLLKKRDSAVKLLRAHALVLEQEVEHLEGLNKTKSTIAREEDMPDADLEVGSDYGEDDYPLDDCEDDDHDDDEDDNHDDEDWEYWL